MVEVLKLVQIILSQLSQDLYLPKQRLFIKGKTTQLLDIRVTNEQNQLISVCKLSTISLPKRK